MSEDKIRAKIIARAWKNKEFCKKLKKNPKEALKEFGIVVSENVEIQTLEEDASHRYFVIPSAPSEMKKLSETELESMAGGKCGTGGVFCTSNIFDPGCTGAF